MQLLQSSSYSSAGQNHNLQWDMPALISIRNIKIYSPWEVISKNSTRKKTLTNYEVWNFTSSTSS